ncbi:MAG TPA: hypothetical protein DEQ34_08620 [Balneolaceae bacterium]|nr:hypothetical protein [Balneolaceae bacterium]|tara:strand:- start:148853 stop:149098 length:246 start_codon:yes stop_codon:yes gene_type:complete
MHFNRLFEELKRRNVFRVATAYAIAGWLIIQVAVVIEEPLSIPDWFDTIIILLVSICLQVQTVVHLTPLSIPENLSTGNWL